MRREGADELAASASRAHRTDTILRSCPPLIDDHSLPNDTSRYTTLLRGTVIVRVTPGERRLAAPNSDRTTQGFDAETLGGGTTPPPTTPSPPPLRDSSGRFTTTPDPALRDSGASRPRRTTHGSDAETQRALHAPRRTHRSAIAAGASPPRRTHRSAIAAGASPPRRTHRSAIAAGASPPRRTHRSAIAAGASPPRRTHRSAIAAGASPPRRTHRSAIAAGASPPRRTHRSARVATKGRSCEIPTPAGSVENAHPRRRRSDPEKTESALSLS